MWLMILVENRAEKRKVSPGGGFQHSSSSSSTSTRQMRCVACVVIGMKSHRVEKGKEKQLPNANKEITLGFFVEIFQIELPKENNQRIPIPKDLDKEESHFLSLDQH